MRFVGIDYSLSSPCVCICKAEDFNFLNCRFYFLTDTKKYNIDIDNIQGDLHSHYFVEEERFYNITRWVCDLLEEEDIIYMEGYSLGSTGRVFNIAENTGILKYKLWQSRIPVEVIPPSAVKKLATGKGNSDKAAMYVQFTQDTDIPLMDIISPEKTKVSNPVSDIVDAFYICKFLYNKIKV